jgi:hypothetical protein
VPPSTPRWQPGRLFESAWQATLLYTALTLATTWPLAAHLTRSLPGGLGDPLLNCWILTWGADHLRAWLAGDPAAFANYWQAPIFHPSPLALAYSEHLFAEAVEIAPVYWLTGNILLAYNVLFLSTFVLSGLGTYLLARDLTGSGPAAWIAGACYAFASYRVGQMPHLQVLASCWLPFVFLGLRRYFARGRGGVPLGATAALIAQCLSCGYYLIFVPPFVAAYCAYELIDRGLWRSTRVWAGLAVAAALTAAACWPFVHPYLELRALSFPPRGLAEVQGYSADLLAYLTASRASRVWGWLQTFPRGEGALFPGLVAPALALIGVAAHVRSLRAATEAGSVATTARRRTAAGVLLGLAAIVAGFALVVGVTNDPAWRVLGITIRLHRQGQAWALVAACLAGAAVLSPRVRRVFRGTPGSAVGFYVAFACLAAWLAMGPAVTLGGHATRLPAIYAAAYAHVPGFDGLRVPSRYVMLAVFALAVLAGFGAQALLAWRPAGRVIVALLGAALVVEATPAPLPLDSPLKDPGYRSAPARVFIGAETPEAYQAAAALPVGSTLIEFPFGPKGWELQYVFYQHAHGLPIVNGYSGGFPAWYETAVAVFGRMADDPDSAWLVLRQTGASHALVHLDAYRGGQGGLVGAWLEAHGAVLHSSGPSYRLYRLPPP